MSLAERMRVEIDDRAERLRNRYGDVSVCETTVENDPEFFAHGRELAEDGWLGDAGAFVTDGDGRALFIRHPNAPETWGVPGGGHEPGESHTETALREVREETGIECEITGVWCARRKTIVLETDREQRLHALTVHFDARAMETAGTSTDDEEVLEAKWFTNPPEPVFDFLEPKVEAWAHSEE
ncbi:NUDIX hydrolase [Haladaptatus caseinilyticus]|uniref:NUDIX hydrolase n=1 Tax=Haladaptatus caseinilyticus TaxID=2993314 RepID=UPI00224A6AB4|nr:NUDIX domain-containing protein [Haladaptatus caseinilyticus]